MRTPLSLLLVLASFTPRAAHAQPLDPRLAVPALEWRTGADARLPAPPRLAARTPEMEIQPGGEVSPVWLLVAGVAGGGLGMMGGGMAGALVDGEPDDDCIDFCFGPGLVVGGLGGEAVGIATAVHLANGRRGSYPAGLLASAAILALGIAVGHEAPEALLLVPAGQVMGAVVVERATGRRRR